MKKIYLFFFYISDLKDKEENLEYNDEIVALLFD